MTPFPTGDDVDDRYFLSQFHSGTAFLHYRIDCFYAVTYIPAAAKESGAASFWSRSGLVKFFRSILEVKLETSPTAHGQGNLKIRLGYY